MTSPKITIDWHTYHNLILQLATKIHRSQWQFDSLLGIARGGLRVGDTLSRLLKKPLAVLSTSSYSDAHQQGQLKIAEHITHTAPLGDRLLIVDDMVDSGATLAAVQKWLERFSLIEIKTAVIWYKGNSCFTPDYFASYLGDSPWIVQPFEVFDQVDLGQLR